jgi:hypothetical protein
MFQANLTARGFSRPHASTKYTWHAGKKQTRRFDRYGGFAKPNRAKQMTE